MCLFPHTISSFTAAAGIGSNIWRRPGSIWKQSRAPLFPGFMCFPSLLLHSILDGDDPGFNGFSIFYVLNCRFTYVMICPMALKCALSFLQPMETENVLMIVQNNMRRMNQMTSPTLTTLSICPL